jgi:hypothetical protein
MNEEDFHLKFSLVRWWNGKLLGGNWKFLNFLQTHLKIQPSNSSYHLHFFRTNKTNFLCSFFSLSLSLFAKSLFVCYVVETVWYKNKKSYFSISSVRAVCSVFLMAKKEKKHKNNKKNIILGSGLLVSSVRPNVVWNFSSNLRVFFIFFR